jgi:hypothetical protein
MLQLVILRKMERQMRKYRLQGNGLLEVETTSSGKPFGIVIRFLIFTNFVFETSRTNAMMDMNVPHLVLSCPDHKNYLHLICSWEFLS